MIILVDTQALIWYLQDPARLSNSASQAISSQNNTRYVSVASLWELSIKHSIGKLQLTVTLSQFFQDVLSNGFYPLGISVNHTIQVSTLPLNPNHKDPFDRLIASQCLVHAWQIVSSDPAFDQYGVARIW